MSTNGDEWRAGESGEPRTNSHPCPGTGTHAVCGWTGCGWMSFVESMSFLDEALSVRERRRAQRWLLRSSTPLLYFLGTLLLPWSVVPGVSSLFSGWSGQSWLESQPRWMFLTLALTVVGGAMAVAFARVSQLWQTERVQQTLEGWFLSRQEPGPVVVTATLSGAALALALSLPGAILIAGAAAPLQVPVLPILLTLTSLLFGALLSAAAATVVFLVSTGKARVSDVSPSERWSAGTPTALAMTAALLAIGLWLRIEAVEHGWARPWEEHPGRLLLAAGLLTPVPAILGFASPQWWVFRVMERLDLPLRPETAALLLLLLYATATVELLRWSEQAYRRLRVDPERAHRAPAPADDVESAEGGSHRYWAGFANPVWTRELRTRLRGREAPQFIFFASVTLAVGGFTPLVSAAGQLGDPIETAAAAREVFFWLAMTLTALIALVAPGLTAEAVGVERARGTLELLLATPLRRHEILLGKLLGDLSVLALLVSPSLPLFGFCYLFHGASAAQVIGIFLVLALTSVVCAVFGITASAVHARTMPAKWQAYLLSLGFCSFFGGPLWLTAALSSPPSGLGADAVGLWATSLLLLIVCGIVLAVLWGRACEQLEYVD